MSSPIPDSIPIHKKWVRENIENKRDEQGRYVNQLRQQYNILFRNLDACINQSELINQKLHLLTQELNDRIAREKNYLVKLKMQKSKFIMEDFGKKTEYIWKNSKMMLKMKLHNCNN